MIRATPGFATNMDTIGYYNVRPNIVTLEMAPQPVIMSQPPRYTAPQGYQWQSDLFDCGKDCKVCACGLFCPCCLGCSIAKEMEECFCCGPSVALRTRYRTQYKIPGSICSDCFTAMCCAPCNLCQLKRDIEKRKELGIF